MKYFFDTEFSEDGHTIEPISFGVVSEDGRELYMEFKIADIKPNTWVEENVIPKLLWGEDMRFIPRGIDARDALLGFVGHEPPPSKTRSGSPIDRPEFWAYYCSYDWVLLCQMFGRMVDLPWHFPKFCRDVQVLYASNPHATKPTKPTNAHNALADARWTMLAHQHVTRAV